MIPLQTDIVIIGAGASGLFCALHLPKQFRILILCKDDLDKSSSFLAQGGMCVLSDEKDYQEYFQDTMAAGHFENNPQAVDTMIRSSPEILQELLALGVPFDRENGQLLFTREGGHSKPRIAFHQDITGKAITSILLEAVQKQTNITILDHFTACDLIEQDNCCYGCVGFDRNHVFHSICANYTILACGGIGGLYSHSTNYRHLTGDAIGMALRHKIAVQHLDYVQIHPTTLYSDQPGRRFLISESVRGEGAVLLDKNYHRFVNELLPRDKLTQAIYQQMKKDNTKHVWLSMIPLGKDKIKAHFPNIYQHCLEQGYDCTAEPIPVVPAQHYFMGGISVNLESKTSMEQLYAIGETACNGVHGANRLASNSLLESLVFAKRAAMDIAQKFPTSHRNEEICKNREDITYENWETQQLKNQELILSHIQKEKTI